MKRLFCFLIFIGLFVSGLYAQTAFKNSGSRPRVKMTISLADTSNNHFFREHPEVHELHVWYGSGIPGTIYIYFDEKNSRNVKREREAFDLRFEGDAYLFKEKYPPLKHNLPKVDIESIYPDNESCPTHDRFEASVFRDSVVYFFSQDCVYDNLKKDNAERGDNFPATPRVRPQELGNNIAEAFRAINTPGQVDSLLVFQGTVGKNLKGESIRNLHLVIGDASVFSDLVEKELAQPLIWTPAILGGVVPRETTIRIYVRLEQDGSVTLKTPSQLLLY